MRRSTVELDGRPVIKKFESGGSNQLDTKFGPHFDADNESTSMKKKKKEAWLFVLRKSSSEEEPEETKELLVAALRKIDKEARQTYEGNVRGLTDFDFRLTMSIDGCYFLQLVIFILGDSTELTETSYSAFYQKKPTRKDIKKWVRSMFYVGNQIPLVVLKELMRAKFFEDYFKSSGDKRDKPPTGFCKGFLYDLLVFPQKREIYGWQQSSSFNLQRAKHLMQQRPSDLLDALRIWLLGPENPSVHNKAPSAQDDNVDLEANEFDDDDDQEATPLVTSGGGEDNTSYNHKKVFKSAMELKEAGIHIRKLRDGGGIRKIRFSSWHFWAYIYVPVLPVDDTTEIIFHHMKNYETVHESWKHKREVTSYLRLMHDLIQTMDDVKLLKDRGIIQMNSDYMEKLPMILGKLIHSEDKSITAELREVKHKILEFSSPWQHYKWVLNIVTFLTFVQTFFALYAYFRPTGKQ